MKNGDAAAYIAAAAAGLAGLTILIFLGYMIVSFMKNARPAEEFGRREDYPMDGIIHKPQMSAQDVKEPAPK